LRLAHVQIEFGHHLSQGLPELKWRFPDDRILNWHCSALEP